MVDGQHLAARRPGPGPPRSPIEVPAARLNGQRHRRQLARVVHRQRPGRRRDLAPGCPAEPTRPAAADVEHAHGREVALVLGQQLHDYPVLVVRGVDRADLPRTVGVVERVLDLITSMPSAAARSAVDRHLDLGFLICRSLVTSASPESRAAAAPAPRRPGTVPRCPSSGG